MVILGRLNLKNKNMKYLIIYNETEVLHITPATGEILTTQMAIISTLEQAKIMLTALEINTDKIDSHKEESYETED